MSTNFCGFDRIIFSNESVGINPPVEIKVILRFNELNILTSEIFNNKKITKLNVEYKMKILDKRSLMLLSQFVLPSPE